MKLKHHTLFLLFIFITSGLFAFSPVDSNYVKSLKTVQFYPYYGIKKDVIYPPVVALSDSIKLRLEFDLLENDAKSLMVSIYYCDSDWNLSQTNEINYLEEYNEFDIFDMQYSFNTKIPFTHYTFDIPKVTLAGNYIVAVYTSDNKYPILSRRFMVYERGETKISKSFYNRQANTSPKQQVDFSVKLVDKEIINPMSNVKVYLRQNGNDFTRTDALQASFFRAYENTIEFNLLDGSNVFDAGSTYRKVDMRSTDFAGYNVGKVNTNQKITEVFVVPDESRRFKPMELADDIYGRYLIDHYEFNDGAINSDYLLTMFSLKYPKTDGEVYLFGQLSDWKIKEEFKMNYVADYKSYTCIPLLKQGYYNYRYALVKDGKIDFVYFEGSHQQRNNYYEIMVYYQVPGQVECELIGYERFFIHE